jgi:hypothetical protein
MIVEAFKVFAKWLLVALAFDIVVFGLILTMRSWRDEMAKQVAIGVTTVAVAFIAMLMLLSSCATLITKPVSGCASLLSNNPYLANAISIAALATHTGLAFYAPEEYKLARISARNMINILKGQTVILEDLNNVPGWAKVIADFMSQVMPAGVPMDECTREHLVDMLEMV